MKSLCTALGLTLLLAAAHAGDSTRHILELEFDGRQGPVEVRLDSETMGFGLHELVPGEPRTIVTDDGRTLTLTREGSNIALEVDGERFEIPAPGHHPRHAEKLQLHLMQGDGLLILSREPLDAVTRETIRTALSAAGVTETVRFHASPEGAGGQHEVRIHEEIEADGVGERVIVRKRIDSGG